MDRGVRATGPGVLYAGTSPYNTPLSIDPRWCRTPKSEAQPHNGLRHLFRKGMMPSAREIPGEKEEEGF